MTENRRLLRAILKNSETDLSKLSDTMLKKIMGTAETRAELEKE